MTKYQLSEEIRNDIKPLLERSSSALSLVNKQEPLDEEEINELLRVLAMFPAYQVFGMIESIRNGINVIKDEPGEAII